MKKIGFRPYRRQMEENLADKLNDQLKKELSGPDYSGMSEDELFSFAEFNAAEAERGGYSNYSYWGATLRMFFKNKTAVFFLILMVALLVFTFIQPYLPGQKDPLLIHNNDWGLPLNNVPPGVGGFLLGTNSILLTLMGSLYVESLYSVPGMGGLLVTAIKRQDNTLVQALVVIYAVISILGLLFGDILMGIVDPRISFAKKEGSR